MKVSIVIPCYNGSRFLPDAIESCLRQTYTDIEVLVVDDGSPDSSAEIANKYAEKDPRLRLLRHTKNRGVSAAFNTGFTAAKGDFMARLAQDDIFMESAIEELVSRLREAPLAGIAYADEIIVDEQKAFLRERRKEGPETVFLSTNGMGMCIMWRREVWEKTGGFRSEFDMAEDYEFLQRALTSFSAVHVDRALLTVRDHAETGTRVHSARQELLVQYVQSRYVKGWIPVRKFLCKACYDAAYNYREQRRWAPAFWLLAKATWHWPFQARTYKSVVGLLLCFARSGGG